MGKKKEEQLRIILYALIALVAAAPSAIAMTTPAPGGFAYGIYQVGVLDLLAGAVGYLIAAGLVVFGAFQLSGENVKGAIKSIGAGGMVASIQGIINSFGMVF